MSDESDGGGCGCIIFIILFLCIWRGCDMAQENENKIEDLEQKIEQMEQTERVWSNPTCQPVEQTEPTEQVGQGGWTN